MRRVAARSVALVRCCSPAQLRRLALTALLLRAAQYPDLEDVCERFRSRGWDWAAAQDMDAVYRHVLDADEKARTERLEMFDEFEEWHMLMQHYCLLYACTDGASDAPDGQTAGDPPAARGSWLRDVALAVAQTEQSGRAG